MYKQKHIEHIIIIIIMNIQAILIAVMAIFEPGVSKTILGADLSSPETHIFENEVREIFHNFREDVKQLDPIRNEHVIHETFGYWVDITKFFAENFSDFHLHHLKISLVSGIQATITVGHVKAESGPFKAGSSQGEIHSKGHNTFRLGSLKLDLKAKISIIPKIQIKDLSFELRVEGASAHFSKLNNDPAFTEKVNREVNKFLTETVNDGNWHELVRSDVERIVNEILESILN